MGGKERKILLLNCIRYKIDIVLDYCGSLCRRKIYTNKVILNEPNNAGDTAL